MLTFNVEYDDEARMFVASWDDPDGGGITTQAEFLRELSDATSGGCTVSLWSSPQKIESASRGSTSFQGRPQCLNSRDASLETFQGRKRSRP